MSDAQVIPLRSAPRPRRVIGISGGKGGVGKSTIAVNLACTFGRLGMRTLLLDGDLGMADLNLLLDVEPKKSLLDLIDGTGGDEILVDAHGIRLLPGLNGSSELANLDAELRGELMRKVTQLAQRFDTTVIDTGAGIHRDTMSLVASADEVVVVATPEPLSTADAYACLKVLALQHGVTRMMVLPNNCRGEAEAQMVVQRLATLARRFLRVELVALPYVPRDASLEETTPGTPHALARPDGRFARAIKRVARALDAQSASQELR